MLFVLKKYSLNYFINKKAQFEFQIELFFDAISVSLYYLYSISNAKRITD